MREIILDTETTGLDPLNGDRVVEIGCVVLINRVPNGETFHQYLNPERPMPPEAERVHGLSDAFLADKPLFSDIVDAFLAFVGDDAIVAHNAPFDFGFLNAELARHGRSPLARERMIDTREIAKARFPGAKASLDALCTRFNIDRSARVKHGALLDAELLAAVYLELTGGRQQTFDLSAAVEAEQQTQTAVMMSDRPYREPRVFEPNADELAAHAAFIAKLNNPIWTRT